MSLRFHRRWAGGSAGTAARFARVAAICLMAACGSGGDDGSGSPVFGAPALASCPGADLSGITARVLVSPEGVDGPNCGADPAGACRTIQQGIVTCKRAGCGVLVRWGLYQTSDAKPPLPDFIEMRDGVSVFGGCRFDDEADRKYRTVVQGPADGKPVIVADSIAQPTLLQGIVALASDAQSAGAGAGAPPSVAMTVSNSGDEFRMSGNTLVAGRGGDGSDGGQPAPAGSGNGGGTTPSGDRAFGGAGCGGGGYGGWGGDNRVSVGFPCNNLGGCTCARETESNNAEAGADSGSAKGGAAGTKIGYSGCACLDRPAGHDVPGPGDSGSPGENGQCGTQDGGRFSDTYGSFAQSHWQPSQGGVGAAGAPGAGGGGGQAGGYAAGPFSNPQRPLDGAVGGGGGGGGCGGQGGNGGGQGGASIALVLVDSQIDLGGSVNVFVAGAGGRGGSGGTGGQGGSGGPGAPGGGGLYDTVCISNAKAPGDGGAGGNGGRGGAGGGGAGGNGGPSIGIALIGASASPQSASYPPGPGGPAGSRGLGARNPPDSSDPNPCKAADGQDGAQGGSTTVASFSTTPGVLQSGQFLSLGQSLHSAGGQYYLAMQTDHNLVLYSADGKVVWATGTYTPWTAGMQTDGNFCLQPGGVWCSGTANHPGAHLVVTNDGRIQVWLGDTVLWSRP